MKTVPKMFFEVATGYVHCGGVVGGDFTLCGFSLDGDQGKTEEWKGEVIDCPQCLAIIAFCWSIPKPSTLL